MTDDVTAFWDALRKKWPKPVPPLNRIDIGDQLQLIQAINTVFMILQRNESNNPK